MLPIREDENYSCLFNFVELKGLQTQKHVAKTCL